MSDGETLIDSPVVPLIGDHGFLGETMKLKTIEQQIIEKSDKELAERIRTELNWLAQNVASPEWHREVTYKIETSSTSQKEVTMKVGEAFQILNAHAFEYMKDRWRQNHLNRFLTKVDSLMSAMEELGLQRMELESTEP